MKYNTLFTILLAGTSLTATADGLAEKLAGNWQFIASNNGVEIAPGIYSAGTETVEFIAAPSSDGTYLQCHTDKLYGSKEISYPGDWRILVEEDGAGKHRLGMVLDSQKPVSAAEFMEEKTAYLEKGFWYFGGTEGGHRYIYLLAENADASALLGMTFWSAWSNEETTEYTISNADYNSKKIYSVVAESMPFADAVGYIEIWSSPKLVRPNILGIRNVGMDAKVGKGDYYTLGGCRLKEKPANPGIYLCNGKKFVVK